MAAGEQDRALAHGSPAAIADNDAAALTEQRARCETGDQVCFPADVVELPRSHIGEHQ
jgi:hypothetical protein